MKLYSASAPTHTTGRNAAAVAAQFRTNSGAMKDRRTPRGGTRNDSRDYLDEFVEELNENDCE